MIRDREESRKEKSVFMIQLIKKVRKRRSQKLFISYCIKKKRNTQKRLYKWTSEKQQRRPIDI